MTFEIIFLDAGQGDATLIVYPDGSLTLVDCGCKKNKDIVETQIYKVLNRYVGSGKHLKNLVLTHPDGDHYNLVKAVLDQGVTVGTVYYGGRAADYAGLTSWLNNHGNAVNFSQGYGSTNVVAGLSYAGGGKEKPKVDTRILSANAGDPAVKADANPNSIVLLVTFLGLNFFLMGDSTELTENFIISNLGTDLNALLTGHRTVLKAGHHGSNSSSKEPWLKKIVPEVCFISSDTRTFSGVSIPREEVVDRIFEFGKLHDFGDKFEHKYVEYNDMTDVHEQVSTTKALYTTLHILKFENQTEFVAYGTTWYYGVDHLGNIEIIPSCGWDNINKAY